MAILSDTYVCMDCEKEFTFTKERPHHEFPSKPKCPDCQNNNTHRKWHGGKMTFNVRKGNVGNASNGYTNERAEYNKRAQKTLKKLQDTKNPLIGTEG